MATPSDHTPDFDVLSERDTPSAERIDSLLAPRLSSRQRAARVGALVGTLLLAVALLFGLSPDLRQSVQRVVFGPTATPTIAITSGSDAIWFTPLAPGETITLDGHALTTLPQPGDPHPLRLSRGTHQLGWQATPFQPQTCLLSVPRAPADTCPTTPALQPTTMPAGRILDDSESLATLSDDQRSSLTTAINLALATTYDATVQPGEYYRPLNVNAVSPNFTPASQPLRASLQVVERSGWTEPCAVVSLAPCRAQGQDCEQLCTLTPSTALNTSNAWYVGLTAGLLWTYSTADGRALEQNAPDTAFTFSLAVLRVTWDGAHWAVTPVFGVKPGLAAAQDLTCGALASELDSWVKLDVTHHFVDVSNQVTYFSDGNPSDGCVGAVSGASVGNAATPTPVTDTPPLLLHRFGVLLAANPQAHALWPGLPYADATEAALASHMAAN